MTAVRGGVTRMMGVVMTMTMEEEVDLGGVLPLPLRMMMIVSDHHHYHHHHLLHLQSQQHPHVVSPLWQCGSGW